MTCGDVSDSPQSLQGIVERHLLNLFHTSSLHERTSILDWRDRLSGCLIREQL